MMRMIKKYTHIIFLLVVLFSFSAQAQENKPFAVSKTQEPSIEGLTIYPNPVNSGKIFITTKSSLDKNSLLKTSATLLNTILVGGIDK